jgi:hypothetical protein
MAKDRHRKRARLPAPPIEPKKSIWQTPTPQPPPVAQRVSEEVQRLRWWFLLHLNWHAQSFWMLLHRDVWRAPDEKAALARWAKQCGVVDSWFMEAAVDTLALWTAFPDSAQARLEPSHMWVFWRGALVFEKPFSVTFQDSLPRIQNGQRESPAEFAERMRTQFDERMKIYRQEYERGYYTAQHYFDQHPQVKEHMLWVVLRFCGASIEETLERWPPADRYEDPVGTITRKTNDLARKIGLTLRPWTRK